MQMMFAYAFNFNQPLNEWDVSNVTNMGYMFQEASKFNQPLDAWNVRRVRDFRSMFDEAHDFNQSIAMWKVKVSAFRDFSFECSYMSNPRFRITSSRSHSRPVRLAKPTSEESATKRPRVAQHEDLAHNTA